MYVGAKNYFVGAVVALLATGAFCLFSSSSDVSPLLKANVEALSRGESGNRPCLENPYYYGTGGVWVCNPCEYMYNLGTPLNGGSWS